jgi:hypothetical protein
MAPLFVAAGLQPRGKGHRNFMKRQEIRDGPSNVRGFFRRPKGLPYGKPGRTRPFLNALSRTIVASEPPRTAEIPLRGSLL